jgi:HPt (histidine-containing phosphotransfer) domain-containing protein
VGPTTDDGAVKDDDEVAESEVDDHELLARVDDDRGLLDKLVQLFLEEAPRVMISIEQAVAAGDASALEQGAHRLSGMLLNLAAHPASAAARLIEASARRRELAEIPAMIADLKIHLAAVSEHFSPPAR